MDEVQSGVIIDIGNLFAAGVGDGDSDMLEGGFDSSSMGVS